jgi:uncharacterized protein (TIGR02246 family)
MAANVSELAASYGLAWATRDVHAIVALHTPDSVFHVHGLTDPAVGRIAIAHAVVAMFGEAPDLSFNTKRAHLGTDHMVFEYLMTGTSAGSGFACDGVDVIAIRDGLVERKDTYLDLIAYQRQGLARFDAQ